jgi:hypothetical protein
MPKKVTELLQTVQRLCSCEMTYILPKGHSSQLRPECRQYLLDQPKEFLVDTLGRVIGLNLILIAKFPVPLEILEKIDLQEKGNTRRLTRKEANQLTKNRLRVMKSGEQGESRDD